ncbi:MAG: phosphoribosyltransferase [Ignavibacteriales bacterium]
MAAYTPEGDVIQLSWDDVMEICRDLAMTIHKDFDPDIVIGVARGGLIPATVIASILRKDLFPVSLSRRMKGVIVREKPEVLVPVSDEVAGKRVLIVDERSETGETLRLAVREAQKKGARKVKTATIFSRPGGWKPNFCGFESDAVVIKPWDYELIVQGKFILNPDYEQELFTRG